MTCAYSELYLDDAMNEMGEMLDYVINDCGYDGDAFFSLFIASGIASQFQCGNPKYVGGMSGVELAISVFNESHPAFLLPEPSYPEDKSPEFWAGWIMAYYQWKTALKFSDMLACGLTFDKVRSMYVLHEADISKFEESATNIIKNSLRSKDTALKTIRRLRGYTQKALSERSGVSLRMIQLYEQRQSNINRAESATVYALARVLHCSMEDLLEPEI